MQYSQVLKKFSVLIVISVVIVATVVTGIISNQKASSITTPCSDGMVLLVNGSTAPTTSITNQLPVLSVNINSLYVNQVREVIFYNDQTALGRATVTGTYSWGMQWATGLSGLNSGQIAKISAKVFYNSPETAGGDASCVSPTIINASISATTPATLEATITPSEWTGPMSYSVTFNTQTTVTGLAPSLEQYALYTWTSTIGFPTPQGKSMQFSSGGTAGTGFVKVTISYGGSSKNLVVPITVKSPDAPLPTDDSNITTPNTTTNTTTTKTGETTVVALSPTIQNPTAQDCVSSAIGNDRFTLINTGQARPTAAEVEKFKLCFATSNYIVPSNFAPVAPTAIKELTKVNTVKIISLENEKRVNNNVAKNVLRIGGKATPNSTVFIYVFSDPLVLTTTTDGDGNWEYILEDPIEPGKHEVYSVVNRGDGVYERSDVLEFTLDATAEAATINPNGLTLKLATATPVQSQRSFGLYIVGSLTVLLFAISGFVITLMKRNKVAVSSSTFSAFPAEQSIDSESGKPQSDEVSGPNSVSDPVINNNSIEPNESTVAAPSNGEEPISESVASDSLGESSNEVKQ